jgi:hypothetical protein
MVTSSYKVPEGQHAKKQPMHNELTENLSMVFWQVGFYAKLSYLFENVKLQWLKPISHLMFFFFVLSQLSFQLRDLGPILYNFFRT